VEHGVDRLRVAVGTERLGSTRDAKPRGRPVAAILERRRRP
jgi:hypothetical protein